MIVVHFLGLFAMLLVLVRRTDSRHFPIVQYYLLRFFLNPIRTWDLFSSLIWQMAKNANIKKNEKSKGRIRVCRIVRGDTRRMDDSVISSWANNFRSQCMPIYLTICNTMGCPFTPALSTNAESSIPYGSRVMRDLNTIISIPKSRFQVGRRTCDEAFLIKSRQPSYLSLEMHFTWGF